MYASHWGLRESPFRNCLDPRCFYQSPTHEEALARLHFLLEQHRRVGLLLGPDGSGSCSCWRSSPPSCAAAGDRRPRSTCWPSSRPRCSGWWRSSWGLNPDPNHSTATLWRMLTDRLLENRYQQIETAILLDDADRPAARSWGRWRDWRNTTARRIRD